MSLRLLLVLALGLCAFGCSEQEEPRRLELPEPDHGPAPDATEDPLGARLHAFGLEHARTLTPDEIIVRGELRQGEVESSPHMLLGTHCYSFVAVGSEGVEDLDVLLVDPAGAPVMHDEDQSRDATIGLAQSICPIEPGMYRVRVRMFRGSGSYALKGFSHQII